MAYFDMGRFDEAEKWLNRARAADRTKVASEYNLGRIAFETNRFYEAAGYFEGILKKDPDNVLALKAAAYTRIKTGELELAEKHYSKLLSLVPESSDDGYNHALVLFAMERYGEAEEVLIRYEYTLLDNSANLLLYARCLKELDRVESIDYYANYLADNKDPKVRYEYAQILVQHELFARALEEYRLCLEEAADAAEPKKSDIHFALAELLLIADSESEEGITELETAVELGFSDIEAVEELQSNANLSTANRDKIRNIVNEMQRILERAKEQEKALEQESSLETEPEAGSDGTGE
ncbi:MAG: tetratricopeptide repeat protein [Treponema sp.]|nr:tetratricopeptide repeat protein [Treponema sp.]